MDEYRKLQELLRGIGSRELSICQGTVNSVDGNLCEVQVGGIAIPGVRLRASELDDDSELLVTPKIGSAVTIGSLSGDLSQLVVLQVDRIETIVVNGGKLGGLVNIMDLTEKLNDLTKTVNSLVSTFNGHTHQTTATAGSSTPGQIFAPASQVNTAKAFTAKDYEDKTIKH